MFAIHTCKDLYLEYIKNLSKVTRKEQHFRRKITKLGNSQRNIPNDQ